MATGEGESEAGREKDGDGARDTLRDIEREGACEADAEPTTEAGTEDAAGHGDPRWSVGAAVRKGAGSAESSEGDGEGQREGSSDDAHDERSEPPPLWASTSRTGEGGVLRLPLPGPLAEAKPLEGEGAGEGTLRPKAIV